MPSYSISGISFSFQSAIHFNGHVVFPHFIFSSNEPNGVQIYRAALDGGELIQKIYAMDEGGRNGRQPPGCRFCRPGSER